MTNVVTKSIIVKGTPEEVYPFWANFETFPNFMENIQSVTRNPDETTHWVMKGTMGMSLEWDATVTRQEKNKRIAWRSTNDDQMQTSGQITFNELPNRQTEITATIQYVPPAGTLGEVGAKLFDDPEARLAQDLKRFKYFVERGPESV